MGVDISNFLVHIIGRTNSPGCIVPQEYTEQDGHSGWRLIVPNNAFLATLISLVRIHMTIDYTNYILPQVVVMIEEYIGRFSKASTVIQAKGARLRHARAIRGVLLEFFDAIDAFKVKSLSREDCVKAQAGKAALIKKIELTINEYHRNVYQL